MLMKFHRTNTIDGAAPIAPEMKVANPLLSFRITQVVFYFALAIFFGGLVTLALVASELFSTMAAAGVHVATMNPHWNQAKQLAGRIFGNILHIFDYVELGCVFLMSAAVLLQMILHFHLKKLWVWARFVLLALLVFLVLHDVFVLFPATRLQHQLWMQNVPANPKAAKLNAAAAKHRAEFHTLHEESEHGGIIEMFLLLGILGISAWGLNWPDRQRHAREIARRSGLVAALPSAVAATTTSAPMADRPAVAAYGASAAPQTDASGTISTSAGPGAAPAGAATPAWPSVAAGHGEIGVNDVAENPIAVTPPSESVADANAPLPPVPLEEPPDAPRNS